MPLTDGIRRLLPNVLSLAKSGKLDWQALRSGAFYVELPSGSLVVEGVSSDWGREYLIRIVNNSGVTIDEGSANEYQDPEFAEVAELFELARRAALQVDRTLAELEEELKRLQGAG